MTKFKITTKTNCHKTTSHYSLQLNGYQQISIIPFEISKFQDDNLYAFIRDNTNIVTKFNKLTILPSIAT